MELSQEQIESLFASREKQLLSKRNFKSVELTRDWARTFPREAGVYIIFEKNKICYIGETGSLRGRMTDMLNTANHVIRRNIGHDKYNGHAEFKRASSRQRFHLDIEALIESDLKRDFKVSAIPIEIGRKELEEWLIKNHTPKYNNKGKRSTPQSKQEKWQSAVNEMYLD